jgi:hypothetical protein
MTLGATQLLTEMSTRNLPGGKGRSARKADKLTAICEPIVYKMWEPRRLTTLLASTACYRDSVTFFLLSSTFPLWFRNSKYFYCLSFPPHKCWNSSLFGQRLVPCKSFPVHHSSVNLVPHHTGTPYDSVTNNDAENIILSGLCRILKREQSDYVGWNTAVKTRLFSLFHFPLRPAV